MCNPESSYWPGKQKRPGADVALTARDGARFMARIARPDGEPPYPTVLIIPDYFDPESYYFDLAEQYAAAGYLGVCPSPFHRHGPLAAQTAELAGARIQKVSDQEVFDDVESVLDFLKRDGLLGDLAITGFCWGAG